VSEEEQDSHPSVDPLSAMSIVQIIAYVEEEARRISGIAGFCLAMARLELEQHHARIQVIEARTNVN
jgi:hypothetical protein